MHVARTQWGGGRRLSDTGFLTCSLGLWSALGVSLLILVSRPSLSIARLPGGVFSGKLRHTETGQGGGRDSWPLGRLQQLPFWFTRYGQGVVDTSVCGGRGWGNFLFFLIQMYKFSISELERVFVCLFVFSATALASDAPSVRLKAGKRTGMVWPSWSPIREHQVRSWRTWQGLGQPSAPASHGKP